MLDRTRSQKPMSKEDVAIVVAARVKTSVHYRDQSQNDRLTAQRIYDGDMSTELSNDADRSRVVSRDLRAAVKKVMPSIKRTLLNNDTIGEFQPVNRGDEEGASQATEFINLIVFPESNGEEAVHDAIHDALLMRVGIVHVWCEEKTEIKVSTHTGMSKEAMEKLVNDEGVEVLEHSEMPDTSQEDQEASGAGQQEEADDLSGGAQGMPPGMPQQGQPMPGGMAAPQMPGQPPQPQGTALQAMPFPPMPLPPLHDVKIKRTDKTRKIKLAVVAPEDFIKDPYSLTIEDSNICGLVEARSRSDLVAMGYDIDRVYAARETDDDNADSRLSNAERNLRNRNLTSIIDRRDNDEALSQATGEVDYFQLFARLDVDGDGIAELRRLVYIGRVAAENEFENEYWDDIPFADFVAERRPHQFEGQSLADDLREIQKVKTVLLRGVMDNVFWQNNLQPIIQEGTIQNMSAVTKPRFGEPIRVTAGTSIKDAVAYNQVPFVAGESFKMIEYFDKEAQDRTGINEASGGLAPDALQNVTAKASAMVEQSGIGQLEEYARTIGRGGLKKVFKLLLKHVIQYQDKPRTIRLRNKWVEYDPRTWNADMDVTVNTGLGAGTRERDMMMMAVVQGAQEKLLAAYGPDNPFVKPDNVWNSLSKMIEAAGLKSPSLFFTKPDPQEVQAKLQAASSKPDPEMQKVQAQIQGQSAIEKMKIEAQAEKDKSQAEGDVAAKAKHAELDAATARHQAELDMQLETHKANLAAKGQSDDLALKKYEIDQKNEIEREKMMHDRSMLHAKTKHETKLHAMTAAAANPDGATAKSADGAIDNSVDPYAEPYVNPAPEKTDMQTLIEQMNKPKRVIYDTSGNVTGIETVN